MFNVVEVPVWIVVLGAIALASLTLSHVLAPSVRWFFRARFNKAMTEINQRLQWKIQPFKLTKRQVLIDRLTYDPQVMQAVEDEASANSEPRHVTADRAARYAREIVPNFSAATYFLLGVRFSRWIVQSLYRVRLGYSDDVKFAELDPDSSVIFVMNHRSNMDYLLVTYLASERTSLSYAAGEWARVWPLEQIAKAMGAYFIRRRSENPLYRKVLARYVQMATENGVTQAIFPEGGLSRDGALKPPKLGLLNYILMEFSADSPRDVIFVPVGLNYDRVLEDRILVGHEVDDNGRPRFRANIATSVGFFLRQILQRMTGRFHKFGYASVSFGTPISLRDYLETNGSAEIEALGETLIKAVGDVIPVLPVPLMATILLTADTPLSRGELTEKAASLRDSLIDHGAHFHLPRGDFEYTVEVGLRLLCKRKLVLVEGDFWSANPDEIELLRYYERSIAHLPR